MCQVLTCPPKRCHFGLSQQPSLRCLDELGLQPLFQSRRRRRHRQGTSDAAYSAVDTLQEQARLSNYVFNVFFFWLEGPLKRRCLKQEAGLLQPCARPKVTAVTRAPALTAPPPHGPAGRTRSPRHPVEEKGNRSFPQQRLGRHPALRFRYAKAPQRHCLTAGGW